MPNSPSPIDRVRAIGRIEALSFVLLLGVAMPLKYFAGLPVWVTVIGWIHGVLFILLAIATFHAWISRHLSFGHACLVGIAALLPLGPWLIDRRLAGLSRRCDEASRKPAET